MDPAPPPVSPAAPVLHPIGRVASTLVEATTAPRQAALGAPPARILVAPPYRAALTGLAVGDEVVVLTWLHRADRGILRVHPEDDPRRPLTGVFATRSQHRPNPIGLHPARVTQLAPDGIGVDHLEAVDGTPVLDLKCRLG